MTSTVYFFDVAANSLEGALDRFAGFFIEPLFNEVSCPACSPTYQLTISQDCTEREILAVDSEHKKNLQNDVWVSKDSPALHEKLSADLRQSSDSSSSRSIFFERITHITSSAREATRRCGRNLKTPDGILGKS